MNYSKLLDGYVVGDILDGDRWEDFKCKSGETFPLHLPYLSGPDICEVCYHFGLDIEYNIGDTQGWSRWTYMEALLKFGIRNKYISDIFTYLLDFGRILSLYHNSPDALNFNEVHKLSKLTIVYVVRNINDYLYSCDYKLIERNMKVCLSTNDKSTFDSKLEPYDKIYLNEGNIGQNSNNKKVKTDVKDQTTHTQYSNPNINIYNTNDMNMSNYYDPYVLSGKLNSSIKELNDNLNELYKKDLNNATKCMKNKKYHKALNLLKKIPDNIIQSEKTLKALKFIISICKLFI